MTELFQVPESLSPRLKWIKKHGIKTRYFSEYDPEEGEHCWAAWIGDVGFNCAEGDTEDEAIGALARMKNIRLWNEEA